MRSDHLTKHKKTHAVGKAVENPKVQGIFWDVGYMKFFKLFCNF